MWACKRNDGHRMQKQVWLWALRKPLQLGMHLKWLGKSASLRSLIWRHPVNGHFVLPPPPMTSKFPANRTHSWGQRREIHVPITTQPHTSLPTVKQWNTCFQNPETSQIGPHIKTFHVMTNTQFLPSHICCVMSDVAFTVSMWRLLTDYHPQGLCHIHTLPADLELSPAVGTVHVK